MGEILAMSVTFTRGLAALALAALAACGNTRSDGPTTLDITRQLVGQVLSGRQSAPAAPAPDPQAMAAEALSVNKGPLIMVGLEGPGTTQVLALTGENGGMRTYMTENEQAVILRGFMLTGTRGLGNDLSVAEAAGTAALVGAGLFQLPEALGEEGIDVAPLVVGTVVSFVVAYASIAWLLRFVAHHSIAWFVPYRVLLGIAVLIGVAVTS